MSAARKSWKPTNKWIAAQCTAVATFAVAWVNAGAWTKPLTIALIGLVSQATVAYLVSNADPAADGATPDADTGEAAPTRGQTASVAGMRSSVA